MISSVVASPVSENRKLVASSIVTEQKSGTCVMNCKFGVRFDLRNEASIAMKGKLAVIQTTTNLSR